MKPKQIDKIRVFVVKPDKPKTKEFVKKELLWFDDFYRNMLTLEGSHLTFEYKLEKYVELEDGTKKPVAKATKEEKEKCGIKEKYLMRPKVEERSYFSDKKEKDEEKVKKWFLSYLNYNNSKAEMEDDKDEVVFEIDKKEMNEFLYQLDRNNFRFRVVK